MVKLRAKVTRCTQLNALHCLSAYWLASILSIFMHNNFIKCEKFSNARRSQANASHIVWVMCACVCEKEIEYFQWKSTKLLCVCNSKVFYTVQNSFHESLLFLCKSVNVLLLFLINSSSSRLAKEVIVCDPWMKLRATPATSSSFCLPFHCRFISHSFHNLSMALK